MGVAHAPGVALAATEGLILPGGARGGAGHDHCVAHRVGAGVGRVDAERHAVEREVSSATVPLQVDIDQDPATASRYGIESMPTVLRGRVLRTEGVLPPSGVLRFVAGN